MRLIKMIERYRIMKPRNSNNIYLYDEITQDIVIEICTGNKQMNRIMMQACYQLLHGAETLELKKLTEESS